MIISIDAMGGDFAPKCNVYGAIEALYLKESLHILLYGDKKLIEEQRQNYYKENPDNSFDKIESRFEVIHCTQDIKMNEDPLKAFSEKKDASMFRGMEDLVEGKSDVFASAGHSGAVMAGAHYIVKPIEGVKRPCLATTWPKPSATPGVLVDAGINIDAKAEFYTDFALMGHLYAKSVFGIKDPKTGLLSIGEEEKKGNKIIKEVFPKLKELRGINFIGNIESRNIFDEVVDIYVCDGFVGNLMLKTIEAFYSAVNKDKRVENDFIDKFNYEYYGGVPVLGINKNLILGHGISSPAAIKNMILTSHKVAEAKLSDVIAKGFSE